MQENTFVVEIVRSFCFLGFDFGAQHATSVFRRQRVSASTEWRDGASSLGRGRVEDGGRVRPLEGRKIGGLKGGLGAEGLRFLLEGCFSSSVSEPLQSLAEVWHPRRPRDTDKGP
eukprot:1737465-Rhodomonas_salina.3